MSSGIGVERKFTLFSPLIADIEVLKKGVVRRSKLYYLRELTGKASRIKEKLDYLNKDKAEAKAKKKAAQTKATEEVNPVENKKEDNK